MYLLSKKFLRCLLQTSVQCLVTVNCYAPLLIFFVIGATFTSSFTLLCEAGKNSAVVSGYNYEKS